jgi:ABC-type amino acid transport substrate-binding protein
MSDIVEDQPRLTEAATATAHGTLPDAQSAKGLGPRSLRRELFWLVPLGITTAGATLFMFLNPRWGPTRPLSGVSRWPGRHRGGYPDRPRRFEGYRTAPAAGPFVVRTWRWMGALIAVMVTVTSAVWWIRREGDPFDYLSGDVRIGYTSVYSGWHTNDTGTDSGFDVDVAREIQGDFPESSHITWVPLGPLENRRAALRGSWDDLAGHSRRRSSL